MNLQYLFQDKISEIRELDPGYSGHASNIWLVKTESEGLLSALRAYGANQITIFGLAATSCLELTPGE